MASAILNRFARLTIVTLWLGFAGQLIAAPDFRRQEADDAIAPLVPAKPRTPEEQKRIEAAAHFATGRLLETRNELRRALEQYRKAIELDPRAVEAYRALVPLAMQLDQSEDAVRLALKAVELDPDDYELLMRIGVEFSRQRDFALGLKYLEQAIKSPRLKHDTPSFVMLNVELGVLYYASKQTEKAADAYAIIFQAVKDPEKFGMEFRTRGAMLNDPRTNYERIGQVLLDGGRLELASEAFELAAKSSKNAAGNLTYNRARILLLSNKPEAALEELQKYFNEQRQSKGRDAYQLLADVLAKLNRSDELIGRLEELAEKDSKNNGLQFFFAESLMAAGELERAKTVYEAALKRGGDSVGYLGLAGVLRRMKRADELLDVLGRGLEKIGPEAMEQLDVELKAVVADAALFDGLVTAGRAQAAAMPPTLTFEEGYLLAKLASELDRVDQALEFYKLAISKEKERAPLAYKEMCELLMEKERYADAAAAYDEVLKLRLPQELKFSFLINLTQARELADDTAGALAAVAEARKSFPGQPAFDFQEAWIYYHSRQYDKAVPLFEQLIKDHAENKLILRRCQFSLSNIHVLKGEIRKGEEILEQVLAEQPEDPAVNNDLGYLYADQGKDLPKAESMIRKAVAAEPENAAYLDSLGWVLFKQGKFKEALEPLEKATKKRQGGDGTIWDHLGDCYHALTRTAEAVDCWKKALADAEKEKHPDTKLIEKIKQKLKDHGGKAATPKPAAEGNP
ncbi:MAG TPA: tetratricopeptide repeat protein [Planctomycetaceae bacterium]|nr:tetratricopeptide repeat protein [Planctomycetaceae bacterium]